MVVKNQIKFIKSLQQKKCRNEHGLFVAEGTKLVKELLLSDLKPKVIYTTDVTHLGSDEVIVEKISEAELKRMSGQNAPNTMLGVFHIPEPKEIATTDWIVALDEIRDPGNLGTIIRLCDWFGIQHIVCATNSVDCYNPKVLRASMGSICRVNISYVPLKATLLALSMPVYGTFMNGDSVYKETLPKAGVLLLGNEANGISEVMLEIISKKLSIPQYGDKTTESLNVAMATALFLGELRRD